MTPKMMEKRLAHLERKNILLILLSLGAGIAAQGQSNKWYKLPFIVADCLLIIVTMIEMVQIFIDRGYFPMTVEAVKGFPDRLDRWVSKRFL